VSDEVELGVSLPLDGDGFLRRECPTCEREFKWLHGSEDEREGEPAPEGGYYCPYCAIQAPANSWLTKPQAALVENLVSREIIGPALEDLGRSLRSIGQSSGGLIKADLKADTPDEMDPLTEPDDMQRVDFGCHPSEPVKVLEDWERAVHCLLCGQLSESFGRV
jgi:hypothetical protein